MIRKLSGALFLAVILFNLFGFYFCFYANRSEIRSAMAKEISTVASERLQEIVLSRAIYQNSLMGHNNELIVDGQYYDVKDVSATGDSVRIVAAFDNEETSLVKDFVATIQNGSAERRQSQDNVVLKFFQLEFCQAEIFQLPAVADNHEQTYFFSECITQRCYSTLSPPPDSNLI